MKRKRITMMIITTSKLIKWFIDQAYQHKFRETIKDPRIIKFFSEYEDRLGYTNQFVAVYRDHFEELQMDPNKDILEQESNHAKDFYNEEYCKRRKDKLDILKKKFQDRLEEIAKKKK